MQKSRVVVVIKDTGDVAAVVVSVAAAARTHACARKVPLSLFSNEFEKQTRRGHYVGIMCRHVCN